jgi:ferrochelatase
MDPNVIDIPALFRAILVFFIVIPFRFFDAFRLRFSSHPEYTPKLAMRYGDPSIKNALKELKNEQIDNLILFPLYPQGTSSSSGTIVESVEDILKRIEYKPKLKVIEPFYSETGYIKALGENIKRKLESDQFDALVFSYHGVPERHIEREVKGCSSECLVSENCCEVLKKENANCYRAQCFESSRKVASYLGLESDFYRTCFQSTFGRAKWIEPELISTLDNLLEEGVKNVLVVCPSFVVDCLENLEEVGMSAKAHFESSGGENLMVTDCLNSDGIWVDFVASKCLEN